MKLLRCLILWATLLSATGLQGCRPPDGGAASGTEKTADAFGFFPVYGIHLGQTTLDEIWELGHKPDVDRRSYSCRMADQTYISDRQKDMIFEEMRIYYWGDTDPTPGEWKEKFKFGKELSCAKWKALFQKLGFQVREQKDYEFSLIATSPDESLVFELDFKRKYEKDGGKEYDMNAPDSLDDMTVKIVQAT
jgi:hypothetical protein